MQHGRRQFLRAAASLLGPPILLRGQQDLPTFSTDVKVVNVLATVTDKKGEIIRDLTKDDFVLYEDKRPQTVRYFAQQSDLPLTIGLMVDTSMSQRRVLDAERGASFRFLEVVLRPSKDHVFLMQFDFRIFTRQELTSSLKALDDALAFVETPTRSQLQIQSGGGTLMFDAVVQAARDVMEKQQGRKALILLTDGVDTGSEATVADAIEAAQRADTLIYSILFADSGAYGFGGADGRKPLQRMAHETGGNTFHRSKKHRNAQSLGVPTRQPTSPAHRGDVAAHPGPVAAVRY